MKSPFRRTGRKAFGRGVTLIQAPTSAVRLHSETRTYVDLHKTWAVHCVTSWIGRQLGSYEPAVFAREDGRDVRREDDPLAALLNAPVEGVSRYEFIRWLISSAALTGNGYAVVIQIDNVVRSLVPVASHVVSFETAQGDGQVDTYVLNLPNGMRRIPRRDMLHIKLFDPSSIYMGQSPVESLRDLLAEDLAASEDRRKFYMYSARPYGIIQRPSTAPVWDDEQREAFAQEWASYFSDRGKGATTGQFSSIVLEDDMEFKPADRISPRDASYIEGRDMVLRAVSANYGIPAQLVNTSSENLSAAARLVEQALAPYAALVEGALTAQLVPRFHDDPRVFVKLLRPITVTDTQAVESLTTAVKGGWLTANEARGAVGLPPHDGGDALQVPSSVVQIGS